MKLIEKEEIDAIERREKLKRAETKKKEILKRI